MNIRFFGIGLILAAVLWAGNLFSMDMVHVYFIEKDNQFDFYADNASYCPFQIYLSFPGEKIRANADLPYYSVIKPSEKNKYLFSVLKKNVTEKDLKFYSRVVVGDPENVKEDLDYPYILPFEENTLRRLGQGYNGRYSHKGWQKYSLDFGMPIGTPVCAAREGVIVDIKQDSTKGGFSWRYMGKANYITIYHPDGTFGQYVHLMPYGSLYDVGTKVKQGQIIGYSGNTGRSSGPHLHFMVSKPVYLERQSMPVKFLDRSGNLVTPKSKQMYYSFHENPNIPAAPADFTGTNETDDIFLDTVGGSIDATNMGSLE
jgi:murein DD-endopeptidase MepM/ murein hydrolase activator NlpD